MNHSDHSTTAMAVLRRAGWLVAACALLLACSRQTGEVQLLPESREGMFYLNFAEAQQVAQSEGKHILLDFWRPG
jgi:hypothetical protein